MELKDGVVIADRFRLVHLLGKGGMGEVWTAHHLSLDIPCAVKFIHAESAQNADVRARFEREAKAAAQLRSPNVVQILDYGVFESTPYIAMEYLDGEPLSERLSRERTLHPSETVRIIGQVGKALSKAHAAGIVHRDLKPENIFLVRDEDGEIAKVLDFGVAKHTSALDSSTRTGALLGTPYFMSPEQAQGTKAIDHRTDLWALAVVAYRCVTGTLPFDSTALGDLLIKIVTQPLPVPSRVVAGLPDGFDAWWSRAACREIDRRYQTAKELVSALSMALNVSVNPSLARTSPSGPPLQVGRSTVLADSSQLPGGGSQPYPSTGSQPYPSTGSQPYPSTGSGASPAQAGYATGGAVQVAHATGGGAVHPAHSTGGGLGDSALLSVGGVVHTQNQAGSRRLALVGALFGASILAAGVVGIVMWRSSGGEAAAAGSADPVSTSAETSASAATTVPDPEPSAAPAVSSAAPIASVAQPAVSASASAEPVASAKAPPPIAKPPTTRRPVVRRPVTATTRKPRKPPVTKPPPDDDSGTDGGLGF